MKCQAFKDFKATSLDKLSYTTGGATDGEIIANRILQGEATNGEIAMYTWNIVQNGWVNSLMSWGSGGYNSFIGYSAQGNRGFSNYQYDISTTPTGGTGSFYSGRQEYNPYTSQ